VPARHTGKNGRGYGDPAPEGKGGGVIIFRGVRPMEMIVARTASWACSWRRGTRRLGWGRRSCSGGHNSCGSRDGIRGVARGVGGEPILLLLLGREIGAADEHDSDNECEKRGRNPYRRVLPTPDAKCRCAATEHCLSPPWRRSGHSRPVSFPGDGAGQPDCSGYASTVRGRLSARIGRGNHSGVGRAAGPLAGPHGPTEVTS
jgi:hypothetical protein